MMSKEIERITTLFEQGKITKEEYQKLLETLTSQKSEKKNWTTILFKPFALLNPLQSLLLALATIFILSVLGYYSENFFSGLLDLRTGAQAPGHLIIENIVIAVTASIVFLILGKVVGSKNIRVIDVFSSLSIARFPMIVAIIGVWCHNLIWGLPPREESFWSLIFLVPIVLLSLVWTLVLFFQATVYSFGISKKRLWILFIAGILLTEIGSSLVNYRFFVQKLPQGIYSRIDAQKLNSTARRVSAQWFKFANEKKYKEMWDLADEEFQASITREDWEKKTSALFKSLGKVIRRKFDVRRKDKENTTFIYKTEFENEGRLIEKLVLRNKDWKVTGYWFH